ncbi:MAG: antibiotic biosynthesis monooxygenase family protein [Gemmatimonadaceae bacterium]
MDKPAYTLAMYRVKAGREQEFIAAWNDLADTFASLPHPPLRGTLIRSLTDRALFYSFGPWRSAVDVQEMRQSAAARSALTVLGGFCEQLTPGDYELIAHVDVEHGTKT